MTLAIPRGFSAEMAEALAINMKLQPAGDRDRLPVSAQRQIFEETRRYWNEQAIPLESVRELTLPSRHGAIACRAYSDGKGKERPLVAYLHGGGWVVGSLDSHDCLARALCAYGGADIVSIDYPLAPEADLQRMVETIVEIVTALAAEGRPIVLAGDSAGGHLAVHAAVRLKGRVTLKGIVSIYGVMAADLSLPSVGAYGDGRYGLNNDRMEHYLRLLGTDRDSADPLHLECGGLPPVMLLAAECDILRDGSYLFAAKLAGEGVFTLSQTAPGMGHAYMGYGRVIGEVEKSAREIGRFIDTYC
ncbi:MAG: hypothetical protein CMO29_23725 [Tistrella sp.]|nr:hypothetical protein [Tistrella sp.]